jgi:hypothetical protein
VLGPPAARPACCYARSNRKRQRAFFPTFHNIYNMNPYRHRLAHTPLNLLGLKMDASSVCHYTIATTHNIVYNRLKKSPFFAKNQCKIRFVFCPDCSQKPREILNFFRKTLIFLRNILQIKNLRSLCSAYYDRSERHKTSFNSLIYKILTASNRKRTKKMQKPMQFFTRFCIAFTIIFHLSFII